MADGNGAQPGTITDPLRSYHFTLMINGVAAGHFTEVTGLAVRVPAIRYREAGARSVVRAVPGRPEFSDVTLRYGLTSSAELWDWLLAAVEGRVERRQVSVAVLDQAGIDEVLRWNLRDAWPTEWVGAPLDALSQSIAVESLRIAHEGLERDVA